VGRDSVREFELVVLRERNGHGTERESWKEETDRKLISRRLRGTRVRGLGGLDSQLGLALLEDSIVVAKELVVGIRHRLGEKPRREKMKKKMIKCVSTAHI
jgi:hypothetical protein